MNTLDAVFDSLEENTPCDLPLNWLQGRTAYGGFSSALALKIARDANHSANNILNSAQISFIGPITSEVIFTAEILRIGKSATYIEVKGKLAITTVFQGTFIFGNERLCCIKV